MRFPVEREQGRTHNLKRIQLRKSIARQRRTRSNATVGSQVGPLKLPLSRYAAFPSMAALDMVQPYVRHVANLPGKPSSISTIGCAATQHPLARDQGSRLVLSTNRSTSDFTSSTEVAAPLILDICSSITLLLIPLAVSRNSIGI